LKNVWFKIFLNSDKEKENLEDLKKEFLDLQGNTREWNSQDTQKHEIDERQIQSNLVCAE